MNTMNTNSETINYVNQDKAKRESSSVHWPAVFAGLFISMIVYFSLLSLGVGIGADQAIGVMQGEDSASSLGSGAGIWFALTVLISLFAGSYASSRVSGLIATRVGYVQGVVVAALFFTLMVSQLGAAIGMLGRGASALTGAAAGAAKSAAENPQVTAVVEDALGDMNLKSSPQVVATGVASRLLRGNEQSAINYLAAQAGISRTEANTRFIQLKEQVQTTAATIGQKTAEAAKAAGWIAFGILFLGSISAMLGGAFGAQLNMRKPMDTLDRKAIRKPSHA